MSSVPESASSPGEGNDDPLHYFSVGNAMDGGTWWAIAHGVKKRSDLLTKQQLLAYVLHFEICCLCFNFWDDWPNQLLFSSFLYRSLKRHTLCLWNFNTLATWCEELTHLKRPWCWEILKVGGEGDDRGWVGWMVSLTQWTWVWANSGSWRWTGKPGVLQSIGVQGVRHNWVTELNWTERDTSLNSQ